MFAGVPRITPSAARRSGAVAARAARRATPTPEMSGADAPRTTASSSSAVAGDGEWCTINNRATYACSQLHWLAVGRKGIGDRVRYVVRTWVARPRGPAGRAGRGERGRGAGAAQGRRRAHT